jgi:hypothetical protein
MDIRQFKVGTLFRGIDFQPVYFSVVTFILVRFNGVLFLPLFKFLVTIALGQWQCFLPWMYSNLTLN